MADDLLWQQLLLKGLLVKIYCLQCHQKMQINKNNGDLQIQLMRCWKVVLLLIFALTRLSAITLHNQHTYTLSQAQTTNFSIKVQQRTRYTLVQFEGRIDMKVTASNGESINTVEEGLFEGVISEEFIGSNVSFTLIAREKSCSGVLQIHAVEKIEQMRYGEEKFIHIRKGEKRVIEINPSSKAQLNIERFNGIPLFANNLCKSYEKKECLDEMHRFTPNELNKHVEVVNLSQCTNCVLLLQITTNSVHAKIRMSISANKTNVQAHPSLMLLKKDQLEHIIIHSDLLSTGKVIIYSGAVELSSSTLSFQDFANGYEYKVQNKSEAGTNGHILTIKCLTVSAYVMVESSLSATQISLIDGLPDTFRLEPNIDYRVTYENHNQGKSNIVLNADSAFLQRLRIKFTNNNTKEHYIIRPKFNFPSQSASQNFQLRKTEETIIIQVTLLSGNAGFLNITAQVNEYISLPLDFTYTSMLEYQEHDDYIIEGLTGSVEVEIKKCVDCSLKYLISEAPIDKNPNNSLNALSVVEAHQMKSSQLFVRIFTTNFAFYSLTVKNEKNTTVKGPILPQAKVNFYLNDDQQNNLLLEFGPPSCNKVACPKVRYFLFEGSDLKHLASKIYCYSSLFDFDERTKDIAFQEFTPTKENEKLSFLLPLKHRDYIGIVAETQGQILTYEVINTEEVKLYKSLRWPFFFLALFVTAALMASFTLFMYLRRKRHEESNGYIRTSKEGSMQSIS